MIIQVKDRFFQMDFIEYITVHHREYGQYTKYYSVHVTTHVVSATEYTTFKVDEGLTQDQAIELVEKYIQQIADQIKGQQICL